MKALILAAALAVAQPATAATLNETGNEILARCTTTNPVDKGWCLGYVRGLMNGYRWLDAALGTKSCIPETVTLGQLRDTLVAYVRANPQDRHRDSMVLLAGMIAKTWPCGGKS